MSGTMPWASSALITPMWAKPRAAPPPSASAILSGGLGATTGGGTGGIGAGGGVAQAESRAAIRSRDRRRMKKTDLCWIPDYGRKIGPIGSLHLAESKKSTLRAN